MYRRANVVDGDRVRARWRFLLNLTILARTTTRDRFAVGVTLLTRLTLAFGRRGSGRGVVHSGRLG